MAVEKIMDFGTISIVSETVHGPTVKDFPGSFVMSNIDDVFAKRIGELFAAFSGAEQDITRILSRLITFNKTHVNDVRRMNFSQRIKVLRKESRKALFASPRAIEIIWQAIDELTIPQDLRNSIAHGMIAYAAASPPVLRITTLYGGKEEERFCRDDEIHYATYLAGVARARLRNLVGPDFDDKLDDPTRELLATIFFDGMV